MKDHLLENKFKKSREENKKKTEIIFNHGNQPFFNNINIFANQINAKLKQIKVNKAITSNTINKNKQKKGHIRSVSSLCP
jgi:hypothetical protein